MELFNAVRELLSMGGDAGVIALAIALWKFDRRLLRLETKMEDRP